MAARVWQLYPSLLPTDQLLLTLSNPTTAASDARVQVTNAVASREYVHIPQRSSTEIGVLPTKAGAAEAAMTVKATVPIVVQRVVIKGGTTQSAYGIPEPDSHAT
jgi:hypothetical protein